MIEKEAVKNYTLSVITIAIKKYIIIELNLDLNIYDLRWKKIANIKYKIHRLMKIYLIGNYNLKKDIIETISYLTN